MSLKPALRHFSLIAFVAVWLLTGVDASAQEASIRGKVLDSRTGEPIAKATVSLRDRKIETRTSDAGEFELAGLTPGEAELYVTTVGYSLVRRKVDVSGILDVEILLGPDVFRRTDEITVTESPFATVEPASVSEHTLTQADMKNLTSVLIDDPLRSVQTLPGVTTGDDFNAQFSLRGAGFRSVGYATDGFLLFAPIFEVADIGGGGSLAMLNGDVVEAMTLSSGGFSVKYGDRTAGYLTITTRQGNRRRFTNTGLASATGVGWTTEGPIGNSRKASWLFSARKSYLDWLIRKLSDDPSSEFIFGFKDFFGKLAFEPSDRHLFRLSGDLGMSRVDQSREKDYGPNDFLFGDSKNRIATGSWLWIISNRLTLDSAGSYDGVVMNNVNHDRQLLFRSTPQQYSIKQDIAYQAGRTHRIEAGYISRRLSQTGVRRRIDYSSTQFVTTDNFSNSTWQTGAYAQDTVSALGSRLAFTYGARMDRLALTKQNVWMPRAGLAFSPASNTKLTLAFGQYAQFPTFFHLLGEFGSPALRAERATHYTFQVEQLLNEKTRVRLEAYNREDRSGIYSADTQYRLVNGAVSGPRIGGIRGEFHNNLRGYARGLEVFIERRSVNKLSGWASYSYGVARYRDAATGIAFDGDFDQRHTFNAYATYRLKPTLNLSAKYRYGSNFPLAAFLAVEGSPPLKQGSVDLSEKPNQSRVPAYSRVDVRLNKAFNFDRWKLTLYGEVLNIVGRKNYRYTTEVDTVNRLMSFDYETMFPRLFIAGIRVEF